MSAPSKLDRIRVQTARMLEIYSLLRRELDGGGRVGLSPQDRERLQHAVDTIAGNMGQLLAQLTAHKEVTSSGEGRSVEAMAADGEDVVDYPGIGRLAGAEARELEEIIDSLLKWHATVGQNDAAQ